MPESPKPENAAAFYAPLREPAFALVWCAIFLSLTSTWMHEVGSAWFMRELADGDPFMVSLVQSAMFLPIMLLSAPMGTLGDLLDRRRFLMLAHGWLILVLGLLWFVTVSGRMTPAILIGLSIALGMGKAMTLPGFAAVIPSLVSAKNLPLGVGLYSMANNAARIIGPALAGAMLAAAGVAFAYAASLVLLGLSLVLLVAWRAPVSGGSQRSAGFFAELGAGLSFSVRDPAYRLIVTRVIAFFLCAASLHALLPVLVDSATVFGIAWGLYGAGALLGATLFPTISRRLTPGAQLSTGILLHALLLGGVAMVEFVPLRMTLLLLLGSAWFQVMASAQVAIQRSLPERLRARGMGIFTSVIMAGFGLGAPLWGLLAKWTTPELGLSMAAALSIVALLFTHRLGVPMQPAASD